MPHRSSWIVAAGGLAALSLPAAHGAHGRTYIESRHHLRNGNIKSNSPQPDKNVGSYDTGEQAAAELQKKGARTLTYSDPAPSAPEPTPAPHRATTSASTEAPADVETPGSTSATTMEPATPASDEGEAEAYEYLGCFHDSKGDRVLGDMFDDPDMTTKVCLDYCTELGAAFMATQWSFQCWCSPDGGLDYNRHYEMMGEDAVCDMPCRGDETEMCGGYDSFELYKLAPASSECSTPVEVYEQCGGEDWTGSTCCSDGHECVDVSGVGCYEQCRPISTEEATPSPTGVTTSTEDTTPSPVAIDDETAPDVTEEPVASTPEPTRPPTATPEVPPTPSPVTAEPVTPPTTPGGGSAPADMQDMLDLHNKARCTHNADTLTWSSEVEASAAVHAKRMSETCDGLFHSDPGQRNGYGENIAWCGDSAGCYSAKNTMSGFYDSEIQTDSVSGYGGHATQILWKSSERLGCAVSSCSSGSRPGDYLVCQYDPPGNNMNDLENQVDLPTNAGTC